MIQSATAAEQRARVWCSDMSHFVSVHVCVCVPTAYLCVHVHT